ncbi:hypothetical protein BOTNAR_0381g00020 [Botryotinia narcissicola]|uniref:DUF7726 domain-containing protein n=1 Tax=Botryotinia narcissicola TaxID=278944 RepID=A0A4Z1HPT7_9HELO|nr:hypothetical protein BOTNAR_0381g00020 [Botryotinia narcissicola]
MSDAAEKQPLNVADSNIRTPPAPILPPPKSKAKDPVKTPASKPPADNKRKASEIEEPQDLPEIDSDNERLHIVDQNCDQIRRKIRTFLESGEMKVTEFQKKIGTNSRSYGAFMGQSGKFKGDQSNVYLNAFIFFKKRELQGVKPPKKPKVSKAEEVKKFDVSAVKLDGESTISVPIYDSCDEVRKKIRAYLREPGIAKTYPEEKKIQSKVLNDFLGKKGPSAGNTSSTYYAAYFFFEKLRIRDGKPKSKHREEMEKQWASEGGVDTKIPSSRGYFCFGDERRVEDKYGKVSFQ